MRFRIVANVLALAACLPALALAQQPAAVMPLPHHEGGWEVSVGAGGTYLDRTLANWVQVTYAGASRVAIGGVVRMGYNFSDRWGLSVGTGFARTTPATVLQPFGALTWTPNLNSRTSPFLTAGVGATYTRWSAAGQTYKITGVGGHLGFGLRQMLSDALSLRVEAREQYERYDHTSIANAVFNGIGTVGLSWFVGGRRALVAHVGVNPPMVTLASLGATEQLTASATDNVGRPLTRRAVAWSSSNDSVASVAADGMVTAVGNGSATITATSEAVSGTANVTVSQTPATLAIAPAADTLTAIGQTRQLAASAQDANNNPIADPQVTWSSSSPAVTVNASGLMTAVGSGTATITATAAGSRSATAQVTVAQVIASLAVMPPAATINAAGGRVQLTARATDANGSPVTGKVVIWAGSAPGVVSLGPTGVATAVGNGTAQITATVEGQTAFATVTVAIPVRAAPAPAAMPAAPPVELPTVNATLVLRSVNFRPNSALLPPEALGDLDAVAAAMKALPNSRWEISGHTSNMGVNARNQLLSRRRALAVRTYLVRQGVPAASLVAVGRGSDVPLVSNATAAGRRQNMRVEIKRLR